MGTVVAITVGLSIWILLWGLGVKSFDAFLITVVIVLGAVVARLLVPILPGNRDE